MSRLHTHFCNLLEIAEMVFSAVRSRNVDFAVLRTVSKLKRLNQLSSVNLYIRDSFSRVYTVISLVRRHRMTGRVYVGMYV